MTIVIIYIYIKKSNVIFFLNNPSGTGYPVGNGKFLKGKKWILSHYAFFILMSLPVTGALFWKSFYIYIINFFDIL